MPNYGDRTSKELEELEYEKQRRMVNFTSEIIKSVCNIIYPKNPESLAYACGMEFKEENSDTKLKNNAKKLAKALPQRSVQRRVVLALLSSSYRNAYLQAEFGLGRDIITAARKGFKFMLEGNVLKPTIKSIAMSSGRFLQLHVCKGVTGRRDLEHFALSYARERIDQHEFEIVRIRDEDTNMNIFDDAMNAVSETDFRFSSGWARTPGHGRMYGQKYIDAYKEDIVSLFRAGALDKSARMGPGKMLEKLREKYPGKLDLPSETEIRQASNVIIVNDMFFGIEFQLIGDSDITSTIILDNCILEKHLVFVCITR